ncbi:hypothetical protein [Massilicoli timonensis]|uniref:hypothetical protein n=1 Tax=Massilicoli timonensis TaxID=2015901 RepID=UPI00248BEBD2|nr:hypothetical protein [Massilicoli timonensis]
MKFLKQTALLIAVIFLLFGVHHSSEWKLDTLSGVVVRANENETQQEEKEGEETSVKKKDVCETYGEGTDDYYQCISDRKASVATSDFITGAIYSLDDVIRGKEIEGKKDYILNFSNSAQTAIAYDIDIADPQTIPMHIVGLVISIIEAIGSMLTTIVMILYNAATSSFWQTTIRSIFTVFDDLVFDWENPNSIFMKFVLLFALITLIQRLVKSFKTVLTPKMIVQIIGSVLCSVALVLFVARYGKPIMDQIETMSNEFLGTTVADLTTELSSDPTSDHEGYEIQTKEMIFEVMQAQGFRLRHFGVTDINRIHAPTDDYNPDLGEKLSGSVKAEQQQVQEEWEKNPSKQQEERYRTLLTDPSKDNAQRERKIYGSTDVIYNFGQSVSVLMLSIIFFVHRALLALVIGIACLLVFGISLMKEILLSVSVYALVKCIVAPDRYSSFSWFVNRFAWMLISLFSKIVLMFVIYLITGLVSKIGSSAVGMLAILAVDAILVIGMIYLAKNAPRLLQKVIGTFHADGSGLIRGALQFAVGKDSPKQVWNDLKNTFASKPDKTENDAEADSEEEAQRKAEAHSDLPTTMGESEEPSAEVQTDATAINETDDSETENKTIATAFEGIDAEDIKDDVKTENEAQGSVSATDTSIPDQETKVDGEESISSRPSTDEDEKPIPHAEHLNGEDERSDSEQESEQLLTKQELSETQAQDSMLSPKEQPTADQTQENDSVSVTDTTDTNGKDPSANEKEDPHDFFEDPSEWEELFRTSDDETI